jgi:hypothetical protein
MATHDASNEGEGSTPVEAVPMYLNAKDGTRVIHDDPWLEPFAPVLRERYLHAFC